VQILDYEESKILYPRIVFHAGDNFAQHEVAVCRIMPSLTVKLLGNTTLEEVVKKE